MNKPFFVFLYLPPSLFLSQLNIRLFMIYSLYWETIFWIQTGKSCSSFFPQNTKQNTGSKWKMHKSMSSIPFKCETEVNGVKSWR